MPHMVDDETNTNKDKKPNYYNKELNIKELRVGKSTRIEGLKKSIILEYNKGTDLIIINSIGATALMIAHKAVALSLNILKRENPDKVFAYMERVFLEGNEVLVIKIAKDQNNL